MRGCRVKAAAAGHTLTAGGDVRFLEQAWDPGAEQQAEDRCNRLGQEAQVYAWKLVAEDTIDEWVAELIEDKRETYRAAIIGEVLDFEGDEIDADSETLIPHRFQERASQAGRA